MTFYANLMYTYVFALNLFIRYVVNCISDLQTEWSLTRALQFDICQETGCQEDEEKCQVQTARNQTKAIGLEAGESNSEGSMRGC